MEIDNDKDMISAQAEPRVRKDQHTKKSSPEEKIKEGGTNNSLYAVSEHSLSQFLDDEPDIYTVSDLKVRYR
jgi:hypothetical protein